jgi:AcrR family transcriptional regulator
MRADARRNYEALLTAARELFLEQGPDAPLDEVAKRAGVGAGTLYRHFPTRADLISAVYLQDIESLCDTAEKLGSEQGPAAALSEFMDLYMSFSMRNSGIKKAVKEMLATESPQAPAVSICKSRLTDISQDLVERAQAADVACQGFEPAVFLKMIHGLSVACDDNPELAPAMLKVMKEGLIKAA